DGGDDPGRRGLRRSDQEHPRPSEGHRGVHEARLDRDDTHAGAEEPVAKTLEEDGQAGLGRAVNVVALPPPVSRDGGEGAEKSGALLLEEVSENREDRDRASEVRVEDPPRLGGIGLRLPLIAQSSEAKDGPGERVPTHFAALPNEGLVGVGPQRVEEDGLRLDPVSDPRVRGDALELPYVPPGELKTVATAGELQRDGPGDGRRGPEDQDRPSLSRHAATIPRRRACEEESRLSGSRRAFTSRKSGSRGYIAAKAVAVVAASLARYSRPP